MTTEIQANNWDFIPFVSTPFPLQALHILSEHQKANKVFEDAEFPLVAPAAFFYSQEQHTKAEQTTPGLSQKLTKASLTELGLASVPIIQATGVSPSIEVQYDAARLHDFKDVLTAVDLVLKKDPTLINRLFTIRETNPQGVYCVWLYVNSVWQKVILDGNLPRRDNDIAIPHCKTELWLDFLIKALAKVHGKTFGRLPETCRHNPTEFLQNILGAIPEDVNLNEQRDNLWRILTGLITKQNVTLVGYRRGSPVPCLFNGFNPQTISLKAVNASGDFKVLGQRAQEQEVSINDLATQFERVVALHFSTMEYYSGIKKAQSNLTSTVAFRAKFSSESAVRVSVEQALAHPNGQLGNFGPTRVLVVREAPINVEHLASAFSANTKGAQTSLRVTAGSYLVLVDIQRTHQGTNAQGQQINAESNEFSVGLISDVKPDSFDRLCDIDVNQAIRGALRSFVSKRTLLVQPEVLTSDRMVLQYQGFEAGYIYSVIANESPKKFISDFQIDVNSLNPGVQNISSGVDYKADSGLFSTGIRPGAQLLAVFKGIPKVAAQPGLPVSYIKGNNQSMRFDNDTPPQAGAPVPEDFNSFVDPRVAGAVTDIEFDDKNVDNMVLRRYIYRNGNPQHRRWRGFDTGVVVYTLADANGLYILFDNKSTNKVLEERLNIESVNLKVANVKSALLISDTTNNNNNFSIKIGPKQSSLVYLTTASQNSYSYSITNHYRITSI